MFPPKRQQLILTLLIVAVICLQRAVAIHNHGAGFILLASVDHAAVPVGFLGALIGFMLLALCAAVTGNPLAAPATLGLGLLILAARGGTIDRWLENIVSPHAYFSLAAESLIWLAPVVVVSLLTHRLRPILRRVLPAFLRCEHFDEAPEPTDPSQTGEHAPSLNSSIVAVPILASVLIVLGLQNPYLADFFGSLVLALVCMVVLWVVCLFGSQITDRFAGRGRRAMTPIAPAFLAGIVTVTVGSLFVQLLVRTSQTGQVIGGLILGFTFAAMIAHQLFPTRARLTILLAPFAVAVGAYVWVGWHLPDTTVMLQLFYHASDRGLLPAAVILPVFYASAGVLGSALGIGWSQSIHLARDQHVLLAA